MRELQKKFGEYYYAFTFVNPLFIEESLFVTVRSPPGFINRENETRCYLNSTFQLLYFNVLFRELVFKIN